MWAVGLASVGLVGVTAWFATKWWSSSGWNYYYRALGYTKTVAQGVMETVMEQRMRFMEVINSRDL
jgi:hypothetical protein